VCWRPGFERLGIGAADQRLRGQVQDHVRLRARNGVLQRCGLADVAGDFPLAGMRADQFMEVRLGGRRQTEADDARPELFEPEGQPRAFEPRVAGDEDALALVVIEEHHQTFQGALPLFHRPASNCCSR